MHHTEGITANTEFEYLKNIMFQVIWVDCRPGESVHNLTKILYSFFAVFDKQHKLQRKHIDQGDSGRTQILSAANASGAGERGSSKNIGTPSASVWIHCDRD